MKYDARAYHFNMDTDCVELLLRDGAFLYVRKTKDVQRRIRPVFIVQDALHDSPVG